MSRLYRWYRITARRKGRLVAVSVAEGDRVISIRRLLSREGRPVAYHREYLVFDPLRPVVEAEMGITNLQGLFDGTGQTVLKRGDLGIQTTVLTQNEAGRLEAEPGSAAFRIEHVFYDFDDQPVSWGWFIIPSEHLMFRATVGAPRVSSATGTTGGEHA